MFEVRALIPEDIIDIEPVLVGLPDDVIEHSIVAGVSFDNVTHCGDFMGVEYRSESTFVLQNGR